MATLGAGQDKASDLVLASLVRARFCEQLSPRIQHGDSDLFLMGMLSLMDNILEIPMRQVLDNVPIDQESKAVLLGGDSRLRPFYQLMLAQEAGEWENCERAGQPAPSQRYRYCGIPLASPAMGASGQCREVIAEKKNLRFRFPQKNSSAL